jgi:hypothetical protein
MTSIPTELPYREDLAPLCPLHFSPMNSDKNHSPTFSCAQPHCGIHWNRLDGYYNVLGKTANHDDPTLLQFLKSAYIVEHGYFYLASVDSSNKKTWRCSVKDCQSFEID